MDRYDPYTDSFISDDVDMRSYMLGYLRGCEDSTKKFVELIKLQFTIPVTKRSDITQGYSEDDK